MSEFLEDWVKTRLGISVDFTQIGNEFFDGNLFFKILQSYDILGPEIKQHFREASSPEDALRNLNLLRVTFKLLNVLRNDNILAEISEKNGPACIDLLNELYLRLSNKHSLPLISKARELQVLQNETGRFQIINVKEKKCPLSPKKKPEESLLSRLQVSVRLFGQEGRHSLNTHTVVNRFQHDSKLRLENASKKAKAEIERRIRECKCGTNLNECLRKFDEKFDLRAAGDAIQNICPPDEYIKMIKLRILKQTSDKEMESKLKDDVVKKLWCKHMKKREEEFRCSFADKLLKQSNYEREMEKRLGQIHMQHNLMIEKRRKIHEEVQKIHFERLNNVVWRKESSTNLNWINDKVRLEQLHRKMYDEKIANIRKKNIDMVKEVFNDIIDFSIKIVIFKLENSMEVPQRDLKQWKVLFYRALPLFPREKQRDSNEEKSKTESESEGSFDSYLEFDEEIEQALNEHDLDEYLILLGPWMKELWLELEDKDEEQDVLGFVVHRLLEFKYPLPLPPEPVDIPMFPIRCVLNNFTDVKVIKTIKSLLEKQRIEVIELPSLIGSCIACYKNEAGIEDKTSKKKVKGKKEEQVPEKKKKKSKVEEPAFKSVEIQFPSLVDMEPKFSKYSELGKKAFEILGAGAPVPEELLLDILVEYLRNLSEREGWVLVNYPNNCRQVHLIESTFTGIPPPIKCIVEIEKEINSSAAINPEENDILIEHLENTEGEDITVNSNLDIKLNELRVSRLVPRPNPAPPMIVFESYFTKYIHVENEKLIQANLNENKKDKLDVDGESPSDENQGNKLLIDNPFEEQTPKDFYETMGNYKYFPFTKLDFPTLKQLCRVILKETDEPGPDRKSSFELFGEAGAKDLAKKKTPKASAKSVAGKSKGLSSVIMVKEEEDTEISKELEEVPLSKISDIISCEVAEPCWKFTILEFASEDKIALASFWESIEISYIQNLMELFSYYRIHDKTVVPYRNSIYKDLTLLMEESDDRQHLVNEFQSGLNSIHDTLRGLGDVKKEFFCRIFELQLKLWELCDVKKTKSEMARKNIINQNWLPKHISRIFNLFVSLLETEFDRFIDTLQLLLIYYMSCLGKPTTTKHPEKYLLPRFKSSDFEAVGEVIKGDTFENGTEESHHHESKEISDYKNKSLIKQQLDFNLDSNGICEQYAEMLLNTDIETTFNTLFVDNMDGLVKNIETEVMNLTKPYLITIEKERKTLLPQKSPNSKKKKGKKESSTGNINSVNMLEELQKKEIHQNTLLEWEKALQNEVDRLSFRIILIKNRFHNDLFELHDLFMVTFHGLFNDISTRYFEQTKSCDNLLRVLMAAVEAESKINAKLILTLQKFFVEKEEDELPIIHPPPVSPIVERDDNFSFTVEQLNRFSEKIISISPLGLTVESLICLIEDMALTGRENGYPYLPAGWSELTRSEIRKLLQNVFGDVVVVDWKDLMVFALEFRFPTLQEIIDARNKFIDYDPHRTETINLNDFNSITLWFEKDLCESLASDLRVVLGKQFIFNLYRVDKDSMNYTAFLINYCKDENPVEGFGKALALITGVGYVLSQDKLYILNRELKESESKVVVEQIINILLHDTLNRAEGIVITEVDEDGNTIDDSECDFIENDYGFFKAEKTLQSAECNIKTTVSRTSRLSTKSRTKSMTKSRGSDTFSIKSKIKAFNLQGETASLKNEEIISDIEQLETNVLWKSWIPFNLVVSLIMTSLLSFALPEDLFYIQKELEDQLRKLYEKEGIQDCIQGHVLAQSQVMKNLFSKCYKFKSCNLTQLVKSVVDSKIRKISVEKNMF